MQLSFSKAIRFGFKMPTFLWTAIFFITTIILGSLLWKSTSQSLMTLLFSRQMNPELLNMTLGIVMNYIVLLCVLFLSGWAIVLFFLHIKGKKEVFDMSPKMTFLFFMKVGVTLALLLLLFLGVMSLTSTMPEIPAQFRTLISDSNMARLHKTIFFGSISANIATFFSIVPKTISLYSDTTDFWGSAWIALKNILLFIIPFVLMTILLIAYTVQFNFKNFGRKILLVVKSPRLLAEILALVFVQAVAMMIVFMILKFFIGLFSKNFIMNTLITIILTVPIFLLARNKKTIILPVVTVVVFLSICLLTPYQFSNYSVVQNWMGYVLCSYYYFYFVCCMAFWASLSHLISQAALIIRDKEMKGPSQ